MDTPNQNPQPQGWPFSLPRSSLQAWIVELESENGLLKASNEMAAEHVARDRKYIGRLEAELDSLKARLKELVCKEQP